MTTNTLTARPLFALATLAALIAGCALPADESDDLSEPGEIGEAEQAINYGGVLTLVNEKKVSYLLAGGSDYQTSGVQIMGGYLYVIFDNNDRVAKLPTSLGYGSGVYTPGTLSDPDMQYEGITFDNHNTAHFYLVSEASTTGTVVQLDGTGSAQGEEYQSTDVTFAAENTGFEGVAWLRRNNNDYLLGLCEGGNCGDETSDAIPGRIKVLRQEGSSWVTEANISLPLVGFSFSDYSDIALYPYGTDYKLAITSQESKRVWVGLLSGTSWSIGGGAVYDFPSSAYCNIEGVTFLSATRLAMVSDKDKTGSASCNTKDESVHIFDLP